MVVLASKGGAVDCPDTLEHTSRQQTSNSDVEGASRGADNAQGEDEGNNANAARKHCQRKPMHYGRDRGGGLHDKRQQRTTTDDDNG